jgi:hypothetical protein
MAWIWSQTSSGGPPGAMVAPMNSPMISPSDVLTSSPTIASSGASRSRASAPSAVLWSVRAMRSRPSSPALATSASRLVALSCE